MLNACPIWSLTTNKNLIKISILLKNNIRIINCHTNQLFLSNNILKFKDIKCDQMKVVFQLKNKDLPNELNELFIFCNYETGFFIQNVNTDNFGYKSLRFSAPSLWNKHLKIDNSINLFTKLTHFKKYLNQFFIKGYTVRKINLLFVTLFFCNFVF